MKNGEGRGINPPVFSMFRLVERWGAVLFWMGGIFYFSSRSDPLGFLPLGQDTADIDKLAHMGEYAGLAALLYRALTGRQQAARDTEHPAAGNPHPTRSDSASRRRAFALAFAVALAYAVFDELHQSLVPGRGGELVDVGNDVTGMAAALGLIWLRERSWRGR